MDTINLHQFSKQKNFLAGNFHLSNRPYHSHAYYNDNISSIDCPIIIIAESDSFNGSRVIVVASIPSLISLVLMTVVAGNF